jgi:hypothetical protein
VEGRDSREKERSRQEDRTGDKTYAVLTLPQQLLLSDVVDPERLANSSDQTALKRYQRRRHILDVGLYNERKGKAMSEGLRGV